MIKTVTQVLKNQGLKYTLFRLQYELKRKLGIFKFTYPSAFSNHSFISFDQWKKQNIHFVSYERNNLNIPHNPHDDIEFNFNQIINGHTLYFNKKWIKNNDWYFNPQSSFQYPKGQHWSEINDMSSVSGDIKFVWEKSRFSFIYDIIRYDYHFQKDNSNFIFKEIFNWIENNPPNTGPNYKCSQEISLRCINWIFALYFYKDNLTFSSDEWNSLLNSILIQIDHVYKNINFSRICVRNNHAITETLFLYFAGVLFPFFKDSSKWKTNGKKWLEKELLYQIYDDGTFLQFSHNYQRVLVQLLSYYLSFSNKNNLDIPSEINSKINSLLKYMSTICVGKKGEVPNYGSNDGALFFRLSSSDYTDYRPQINALSFCLNKTLVFNSSLTSEESMWLNEDVKTSDEHSQISDEVSSFDKGGIYTISDSDTFTFFKSCSYKDRPAHADNLHLDLWYKGINVVRDSGTYSYNTSSDLINYFSGTIGHNTVILDDVNQMQKGSRFIWFNWTKEAHCEIEETAEWILFKAEAKMFSELGADIIHRREVKKYRNKSEWLITDRIINKPAHVSMKQLWHPDNKYSSMISFDSRDSNKTLNASKDAGYWSSYYGIKEESEFVFYQTNDSFIETKITISE